MSDSDNSTPASQQTPQAVKDFGLGFASALPITLWIPKLAFLIYESTTQSVFALNWIASLPIYYTVDRWTQQASRGPVLHLVLALSLLTAPAIGSAVATRSAGGRWMLSGILFGVSYSVVLGLIVAIFGSVSFLDGSAISGLLILNIGSAVVGAWLGTFRHRERLRPSSAPAAKSVDSIAGGLSDLPESGIAGLAVVIGSPTIQVTESDITEIYARKNPTWSRRHPVRMFRTATELSSDGNAVAEAIKAGLQNDWARGLGDVIVYAQDCDLTVEQVAAQSSLTAPAVLLTLFRSSVGKKLVPIGSRELRFKSDLAGVSARA